MYRKTGIVHIILLDAFYAFVKKNRSNLEFSSTWNKLTMFSWYIYYGSSKLQTHNFHRQAVPLLYRSYLPQTFFWNESQVATICDHDFWSSFLWQ